MDKKLKYKTCWLRPTFLSGLKKPIHIFNKRNDICAVEISPEETRGKISQKIKEIKEVRHERIWQGKKNVLTCWLSGRHFIFCKRMYLRLQI